MDSFGGDGANVGNEAGGFATDGSYGVGFGTPGGNENFDAITANFASTAWGVVLGWFGDKVLDAGWEAVQNNYAGVTISGPDYGAYDAMGNYGGINTSTGGFEGN